MVPGVKDFVDCPECLRQVGSADVLSCRCRGGPLRCKLFHVTCRPHGRERPVCLVELDAIKAFYGPLRHPKAPYGNVPGDSLLIDSEDSSWVAHVLNSVQALPMNKRERPPFARRMVPHDMHCGGHPSELTLFGLAWRFEVQGIHWNPSGCKVFAGPTNLVFRPFGHPRPYSYLPIDKTSKDT